MRSGTKDFTDELKLRFSRSGGPGGQNVNKVNTKSEVGLNIERSKLLSDSDKARIIHKLQNRINKEGELWVDCQTERSQLQNKVLAIKKINQILNQALQRKKIRISTKPSKSSKKIRLEKKKQIGQKKIMRRKPDF